MNRMYELIELINKYNEEYYTNDNSSISDQEYDALYDELVALEQDTGIVLDNSPTKKVGGNIKSSFQKHKHQHRLYSLDKVRTAQAVESWIEKIKQQLGEDTQFSLEHKYDGLTLNLCYDKGKLISVATRGDGIEGELVTNGCKNMPSIPKTISFKGYIEVQGEGIMPLSALKAYNEKADEPLKNARNACSGAIRNLDPMETKNKGIVFYAYNVGYIEGKTIKTQQEMHDFLAELGFSTGYFELLSSADDIMYNIQQVEHMRSDLDYLIDGMVIKVNDAEQRENLGYTIKFPRWAVAYKFKAEEVTTIVKDVIWQVTRQGRLAPLAVLESVDIAGVCVSRATLSNVSEIKRKDIKINSRVLVRRSGDVIPEIMGVTEHYDNSIEIEPPKICPFCGSPTKQEGVFIYCTNHEDCLPRIVASIAHFCEKDAMNIEGLSEKTVEQLVLEKEVKTPLELYSLTLDDLLLLDGFKEKKAGNIIDAIEKSKLTTLARFLYALGIPNIGKKAAGQLEQAFETLDGIKNATVLELLALDDFGPIMADGVVSFFAKSQNLKLIDGFINVGIVFEKQQKGSGVFDGKTVVITGTLQTMNRREAQKKIEQQGGIVKDAVTKQVNLVIRGDSAGSKLDKAQSLGIEIIDEQTFLDWLKK